MSTPLRVVSVAIKDVLGAKEFALEPGQITTLSGPNGSGKSSALAAVQAAIGGGSLAKLARVDASGDPTEPEVVLVMENDSEHYRVERTGEKVRVRARVGDTAAFEDVPKPQTWLSSLYDNQGANPVAFLTAKDKDRAVMLLEALPLVYAREDLLREMGITPAELKAMGAIPAGLHPLQEVALIREAVFRTRTGVNRDQKQQVAAAEQLRRNLPAVLPGDRAEELRALEADVAGLTQQMARAIADAKHTYERALQTAREQAEAFRLQVQGDFRLEATRLRRAHDERAAAWRAAVERQIAEDLAAVNTDVDVARAAGEAQIEGADQAAEIATMDATQRFQAVQHVVAEQQQEVARKREQLAAWRAEAETATKARALDEQATAFDQEALRLETEGQRLTTALDALDRHRRQMAEHLPIAGLSIDDATIRVNGVPFEQLNTAQKVEIAVKVATLRAKGQRLPVVFVDGAEALDTAHFDALTASLQAHGLQAFIARVADREFAVSTR